MFRLGFIVNPLAGLGGPAGLKGSDAADTLTIATERGVVSQTPDRVGLFLSHLSDLSDGVHILTASGAMGADLLRSNGWPAQVVYQFQGVSSSQDTMAAAKAVIEESVDLLVFVGGDGTARDVCKAVGPKHAVLGLPAGVKMHSGVFAVTPAAAASVIQSLIKGRLVSARLAEVRDIDEAAFRDGKVSTRYYGEMLIPDDQLLVQCVKCSGLPDDELQLEELCAYLEEQFEPDELYILGSGGTLFRLKQKLGLAKPTLLGIDLWYNGEQIASDIYEQQIFELIKQHSKINILLSIIGGQGIVLGRGNQQLSPRVIRAAGLNSIKFVATHEKLKALEGRPLLLDSGDDRLDRDLSGIRPVICGYDDAVFYPFRYTE